MSSEPPPVRWLSGVGRPMLNTPRCWSPRSGTPISFCTARAIAWSLSSHCGMPTRSMFACVTSAIVLLKCALHPEPTIITVSSSTFAIIAAPRAMRLPCSNSAIVRA